MKASSNNRQQILLGLLILLILGVVGWHSVVWLWRLFSGLQKEVSASIVAAVATVLVTVISVSLGKYFERKRLIEQELREKKIPMYEEFVEFLFRLLMADKMTLAQMTEKEMMDFFRKFTPKLMAWGSDEVVKQWSSYRLLLSKGIQPSDSMFELEKLLFAMRKDTGHKNKNVGRGDLLGLFINDIDKYR